MALPPTPTLNARERAKIEDLAARARKLPRPLLVALDVDGTLAPIVDDPDAARIPPDTARSLRTLADARGFRVALVTGRDARSLGRMAKLDGIYRAVEHGRRLLAPGEPNRKRALPADDKDRLAGFRDWAEEHAVPAGARLEDKDGAVAVHVRELTERAPARAKRVLEQAKAAAIAHRLHPRKGRNVLEAETDTGDKGSALRTIHRELRAKGVVYAGDDLTDGPAIRAAAELGGLGLFVRSKERPRPPRGATAALAGTEAVAAFLARLVPGR